MPNSVAYWVAPNGKSIDVGTNTHIKYIINNPKIFGLDKKKIIDKYAEYGETIGIEGDARGEIMMNLMKKGWLRVRHIPRKDSWTIQTYYFGNKEKNNIWDWVREARKKNWANAFADIRILITKSGRIIDSSFSELVKGKKIFEIRKPIDEISFFDIIKIKNESTIEELNEASIGRVYQHWKKSGETGFMIITSWRAGYSKKKNLDLFKQLQKEIRSNGLGFIELEGHWIECQDTTVSYDKCPPTKLVASTEPVLFVPGATLQLTKKLAKKYDQDAAVYSGKETEGKVSLVFKNESIQNIGKFHPGKIAQAFSKLRGRTFTFEGFEYKAQSFIESLIEQNYKKLLDE